MCESVSVSVTGEIGWTVLVAVAPVAGLDDVGLRVQHVVSCHVDYRDGGDDDQEAVDAEDVEIERTLLLLVAQANHSWSSVLGFVRGFGVGPQQLARHSQKKVTLN